MLSFRKHLRQQQRVSDKILADVFFDVDEFIELIVRKQARRTTWKENRYIRMQVKQNPKAAQAWQDAKETSPHERFSLYGYHPPLRKVLAVCLLVALIAVGVYALMRRYDINVQVHIEPKETYNPRFTKKPLGDIAAMIEDTYAKKVVFDRAEIRQKLLSGKMDTSKGLEDFLEDLRNNGVDNYMDDKGLIHIR